MGQQSQLPGRWNDAAVNFQPFGCASIPWNISWKLAGEKVCVLNLKGSINTVLEVKFNLAMCDRFNQK